MTRLAHHTNENELLIAFRAGSEQAFSDVYKLLYQRVYCFAKKYLEETTDAQDATAETFVQLIQHRETFHTLDGIAAFLYVAVRNKCFNLLKHKRVKAAHRAALSHLLQDQDSPPFFVEQVQLELIRKIYIEVEKLPSRMKEVFLLSYQEGLKPSQIAKRMNLKVQTVTNQRVNAIKLLKLALQKDSLLLALLMASELEGQLLL